MNGVFDRKAKSVYIDTGEKHGRKSSVLGAVLLFLCVFAGCFGIIASVADSFEFHVPAYWLALELLKYLLLFALIYFVPSRLLTFLALLAGAGVLALYVWRNFEQVFSQAGAALNWCLFVINEAGYNIGALVDRDLARSTPHEYYQGTFTLVIILMAAVFSYLVYSRKSVFFTVILSVAAIFPGFFYGLIPGYFTFALVAAFWVSHFAVNMFDAGYISQLLNRQGAVPEHKLAKIRLREFRLEHRANVKNIRDEIRATANLPNPDENVLKLERLLRQLESYEKPGFWFIRLHGLNKLKLRKAKGKPVNLIKAEKQKIKRELEGIKKAEREELAAAKKIYKSMGLGERLKIRFRHDFGEKKNFFTRSGFGAAFAYAVALAAVMLVQPFIAPDARFDLLSMPEHMLMTLTSTIEHALVGSDARVYGGHSGGMGGGNLYRTGGASFRHRPILQINLQGRPQLSSDVIYLKGFIGTIYDGQRWIEADRSHVEAYNRLMQREIFANYRPENYFSTFTRYMQNAARANYRRRGEELMRDQVTVEHLVMGGRLIFTPHFMTGDIRSNFNIRRIADLHTEVTNSVFRRPSYIVDFYSIDNVLDRSTDQPVNNMRDYLRRYNNLLAVLELWERDALEARFPGMRIMSRAELEGLHEGDGEVEVSQLLRELFYEYVPFWDVCCLFGADTAMLIPAEYANEFQEFRRAAQLHTGIMPVDFMLSESAYYEFVREHYLQLPEMPPAVLELALELTEGLETPFDKALAIEHFLATSFEYTLSPLSPRDPTLDFVYNFLFDVQEGFCTYYATAMTIMMRLLGVPARGVEGFLVDTRNVTRDENGDPLAIVILDSNAHAWTEVYLRGVGWLPFEPTASAEQQPEEEEHRPHVFVPATSRLPGGGDGMMLMPFDDWDDDWEPGGSGGVEMPALLRLALVVLPVILVVAAFYFINYGVNRKRDKYFKTADTNAAALKMLDYILRFLKLCGFTIRSDEGLVDFAGRMSQSFPMLRSEGWLNLMKIMQKARYSVHEITEREREYACKFIAELREECLKNLRFGLKFKLRFVRFVL